MKNYILLSLLGFVLLSCKKEINESELNLQKNDLDRYEILFKKGYIFTIKPLYGIPVTKFGAKFPFKNPKKKIQIPNHQFYSMAKFIIQ